MLQYIQVIVWRLYFRLDPGHFGLGLARIEFILGGFACQVTIEDPKKKKKKKKKEI